MITIEKLDCKPVVDPYQSGMRRPTRTLLTLTEDGRFFAEQEGDSNSTSEPVWNGVWTAELAQTWPTENALRHYIEYGGGRELLEIVLAEHKVDVSWDGRLHGGLTDEGLDAWSEFIRDVNSMDYDQVYDPYHVEDMLEGWRPAGDEDLDETVEEFERHAEREGYLLLGDLRTAVARKLEQ